MRGQTWLCRGFVLLVAAGCSHGSSAVRDAPVEQWTTEDTGIRTKGGDSVSSRIPILIARGELKEAEELLKHLLAAGLLSQAVATQWQERIDRGKERQNREPHRIPPPISSEDLTPEEPASQRRTCSTELPNHPVCRELPEEYTFHSVRMALETMKQRLGAKSLNLHSPTDARSGPCQEVGKHYNVRMDGERAGSIVCCPCCVENEPDPLLWEKCRIVW
jgi:hypothetical protein